MLPLDVTPATVVVGLVIATLAVLAVRRLVRNGTCDCRKGSPRGGKAGAAQADGCVGGCAGCSGCAAADRMVAEVARTVQINRN